MNFGTLPGGTQVEIIHPGEGNGFIPGSSKQVSNTRLLTCKPLKADTRLVNLLEGLGGLVTVGWQLCLAAWWPLTSRGRRICCYVYDWGDGQISKHQFEIIGIHQNFK